VRSNARLLVHPSDRGRAAAEAAVTEALAVINPSLYGALVVKPARELPAGRGGGVISNDLPCQRVGWADPAASRGNPPAPVESGGFRRRPSTRLRRFFPVRV